MTVARLYLVQEKETGLFLAPGESGDVEFVKLLSKAGFFDDYETARDTAVIQLGDDFAITSLLVDIDSLPLK